MINVLLGDKDITSICGEFTIKGSLEQVSRQLDMKVMRGDINEDLPSIEVKPGDIITIIEKDKIVFTGVVWFRTLDDNNVIQDFTAYDLLIYLNKSDVETSVFTNKNCDEIAKLVCKELGLDTGELAKGEKINLNGRGSNGYEIIMSAYTKAMRANSKKYQMIADGKKVTVIEKGKLIDIKIKYGNENAEAQYTPGTILNVEIEESLDEMVNKVKVINQDKADKKEEVAKNDKDIKEYGLIQKIVNSTDEDVKGLLKGAKTEMHTECFANWDMITGYSIEVDSKLLKGKFYIESDEHSYYDGIHTVKLVLSTENRMDEIEEGGSENEDSEDDYDGKENGTVRADSASLNKMLNYALSKEGYRYSQAQRMSANAFDCSSLVLRSMRAAGLDTTGANLTTRTIHGDSRFTKISKSQMKPGDVLWKSGHMALYIGNGKTIEAMTPSKGVRKGSASYFTQAFRVKGA